MKSGNLNFLEHSGPLRGLGSSVGIATGYGLDGPGIESRWGRDRSWGPPSLLYNGYRVFPGVKCGQGVTLTPHPLLVPWSRNSWAIPLLTPWAIRPVQSLSACTRVHFTFTFTFFVFESRISNLFVIDIPRAEIGISSSPRPPKQRPAVAIFFFTLVTVRHIFSNVVRLM